MIRIGKGGNLNKPGDVEGTFVEIEGEDYYMIRNYDNMSPFLITIVSNSDHWMYISSSGSLSAGRLNPEHAIFPYYTDDKIHDYKEVTGSKTIILAQTGVERYLWEPFSVKYDGIYNTERNIYKNKAGNKIIFEEKNFDLKLSFRYKWMNSERFGWIRKSSIKNQDSELVKASIVDGIQNILPYGVQRIMQGMLSTLLDAYKKCELVDDYSLVLYRMSSIPVDRAEPNEALKATTVWSTGLNESKILLSNRQIDAFRRAEDIHTENESRGIKGSYYINSDIVLQPGGTNCWYITAEVCQDSSQIVALVNILKSGCDISTEIENDVERGCETLFSLISIADGIQNTSDKLNGWRHFSNTMFNIMRGGIPAANYKLQKTNYKKHILLFNKELYIRKREWIETLPDEVEYYELLEKANKLGDPDIIRLTMEYLPLMFSRRHGDPSRPWNLFNIKLKNNDGTPSLFYQGNWRDIFQNWEALANTYPGFLPGMISKFLNATTIDGYNPYKITSEGFDWEIMDPSDPWSNIGYWGDHQIIYLEKLLELSEKYFPGNLQNWMEQEIFTFANVPYRHNPYKEIVKTPQDTILFDSAENHKIEDSVKKTGGDGKLLTANNEILRSNFSVKVLVPLLSKLSNFIPGAGIWMNTQRPEWNDANNALVGNGASMVTLYYIRRYVHFLLKVFEKSKSDKWIIPVEVYSLYLDIEDVLKTNIKKAAGNLTDEERKVILDGLGNAGTTFRGKVYKNITGVNNSLSKDEMISFLGIIQQYADFSIRDNKRPDGLFNAYNLVKISEGKVTIRNLYEMLEGQVALLSSGYLSPSESVELLDKIRCSRLYREDQRSYILYPDRRLPLFLERNNIPQEQVEHNKLLMNLITDGNTDIIIKDENGHYHFNGEINNGNTLKGRLSKLINKESADNKGNDIETVLDIYEQQFDHQSFTGRSGSFYKYEGLGCIYWHMVSKLLLAVGESILLAEENNAGQAVTDRLRKHYVTIREGIGSHKKPIEYGAFPTDPYSHTPSMAGVQQPGMTGQVKEDLLSRMIELGIKIMEGEISFRPVTLKKSDFIESQELPYTYISFTFCGTPVIYCITGKNATVVEMMNGKEKVYNQSKIDAEMSRAIFLRNGDIKIIKVSFDDLLIKDE